mgnify:CR=1 FL=1
MSNFDFAGWATRNDLQCSDGRIIRRNAFKDCDGKRVPIIWMHQHDNPDAVLGHAILENRDDGVYTYGYLNDSEQAKTAKLLLQHGDIDSLSIWANQLKQDGPNVMHGNIREVSLVLAGANPGAHIDSVIVHGEEFDDEAVIYTGKNLSLFHSDEGAGEGENPTLSHAEGDQKGDKPMNGDTTNNNNAKPSDGDKTIKDVFDTLTEEQKTAVYAVIGTALEDAGVDTENDNTENGGDNNMKHNVFDNGDAYRANVISHSDQEQILELAKQSNVGSLKTAMEIFAEESDSLSHGFEDYEQLFPEYELTNPGAPELLERDHSWVSSVINKIHKSPISRIRTRQADARIETLRAKGYQRKGDEKKITGQIKLLSRTTDPQTVYIKDNMHRDDIVDIKDFDVVAYQWNIMRNTLNEELALAALIGDGRDEGDPDKIHETHIRSIWNDDELYTIHKDIDIAAARKELQGTDTGANFGDNYVYAEAIITAALYSREKYKGSGTPDLYCTPHLLNVMLLARDRNGRRIYDSKADLAAALNVGEIVTVEQFEGKTRATTDGKTKKLLGLFVNLADYQFGSTKGGEITKFEDFDMDFNRYKYMLETRLSGALTKVYSAIALEEPVATTPDTHSVG